MAQINTNLPAPSADGVGAWVDVSAYGALKTILVAGDHDAIVTIEISNAATANDASAAPLVGFNPRGKRTLSVAARWMRVRVSNYNVHVGGTPQVDVSGSDDGTEFASLVATSGNGTGAPVDVSALGIFKTVHVGNAFRGSLQLEVSNDAGTTWTQIMSFDTPGQYSAVFSAQYMRLKRNGVPRNSPGLPVVNVGFCANATGGGGGGGGGGDRGWYGTAIDGDYESNGDDSQTRDVYYGDMLIHAGDTYYTNGFKLAVAGTLTIEDGGFLDNSGTGATGAPAGTLLGGGNGGSYSLQAEIPRAGVPGDSPNWWPVAHPPGSGGDGGDTVNTSFPFQLIEGGSGGTPNVGLGAGPYTIEQIASGDGVCGGAGGGGGGTNGNPSATGPGGGGGGVMVIKARFMNVPDNAIRCRGADGGNGTGSAGGGGGGQGGVVLIITDEPEVPVCDVSGGAGGLGSGAGGTNGTAGSDGVVIAISPIHGPL